ncbi:uncharacterized protein LOC141639750 [Silene latifolia]|uniref:uncharacterized protein LOC141639750 n=1 Tax=Silene latifolia TaxID=37657 RepID=UPI003D76BD31
MSALNNSELHDIEETTQLNEKSIARCLLPYDLDLDLDDIPEELEELEEEPDVEIFQQQDETWTEVVNKKSKQQTPKPSPQVKPKNLIQISAEDVAPEISYWKSSVYCYILGASPPWNVVDGFIRRVWGKYDVDKVSFLPNGIFLVRFKTLEMQQKALLSDQIMFDNKPVIVHEWKTDTELVKHEIATLPIWIKLVGLELKFWGENALKKISGIVGDYMRCDEATAHKTLLSYSKVLVKVQMNQQFPDFVEFMDEKGGVQRVRVEYDWLPILCTHCKGMGHLAANCRKPDSKAKDKPKAKVLPSPPVAKNFQGTAKTPTENRPLQTPVRILTRLNSQEYVRDSSGKTTFMEVFNSAIHKSVQMAKGGLNGLKNREQSIVEEGLFGLVETKVKNNNWLSVRNNVCYDWALCTNNSKHKGGRVWLIWNPQCYDVHIEDITSQTIHSHVKYKVHGRSFWFTCVYGFNDQNQRKEMWASLKSYSGNCSDPWAIGGDFNNDVKAIGSFFTWTNKQGIDTRKYSRIVRLLVNGEWLQRFPEAFAHFMPEGIFDHCPCVVQFGVAAQRKKASFKYYNMWSLFSGFTHIVESHWDDQIDDTPMFKLITNLKRLKRPLKEINKENFQDIEHTTSLTLMALTQLQERLRESPLDPALIMAEREVSKEYAVLLNAKHQFLLQKSKATWAIEGDDNTAFFHASLRAKRNRNKVIQIEDVNGRCQSIPYEINSAFEEFFIQILGTNFEVKKVHKPTVQKGKVITSEHHEKLLRKVTVEEIRMAMFSIPGTKAPGPDGYSSQFFKDTWSITGTTVDIPVSVTQYKPIACFNTVYKCIAKLLCNRLSDVLPHIISPNQSAFVKGRDIVENILICQDLVKLYGRKACSPRLLMKIDLQKAYDSIEWSFVREMLEALMFPEKFIRLIMECVTTPSFSLALNGDLFGFFKGKRGIRQGDPLSPLLFTICMEYLSRILQVVQDYEGFKYHPLCKPMKLSHLCFADDLLLFCKGDINSVTILLRAFETFSHASGLKMNRSKSCIYGNGIAKDTFSEIICLAGIPAGRLPFRYLRVPIIAKKISSLECSKLVERVVDRIRAIGARKLSYAGRLTLIKSVLSNLHCYWARIFVLPVRILNKVEAICRSFLWQGKEVAQGPALIAWDTCCTGKKKGGLGIIDLRRWNYAALGKYIWWIAQKADHLWVKWIHAVYMKTGGWCDYVPTAGSSWSWRKLCAVKDKLKHGYCGDWWLMKGGIYSIKAGYTWLRLTHSNVNWIPFVWNRLSPPKHCFIGWLVAHGRLLTRDRLHKMLICEETACCICGNQDESHAHLFFECAYSRECLLLIKALLKVNVPTGNVVQWWLKLRMRSLLRKQMIGAVIQALVYRLWEMRNKCRVEGVLLRPRNLVLLVQQDVRLRLQGLNSCGKISEVCKAWI